MGVVGVGVDQDDALPGPQNRLTVDNRHAHRRCDEGRDNVVAAVTQRTVAMGIDVLNRKQAFECFLEVGFGARTSLDDGDTCGRVRDEDVNQPVPKAPSEPPHVRSEVDG